MFSRIVTSIKNILRTIVWVLSFGLISRNTVNSQECSIAKEELYESFQPLYDTMIIDNEGTSVSFFQVPLGGTVAHKSIPKTQVETDMDQGGSLPFPKTYFITGITVTPSPETAYKDAMQVISNSWLRVFVGTQDKLCIPVNLASYVANMSEYSYPGPVFHFQDNPIKLIPQQNFRVEMNMPQILGLSKPVKMQVILHGYFEYTIQYRTRPDGSLDQVFTCADNYYVPQASHRLHIWNS